MSYSVTIGIPCYNAEKWLQAAVESALAQMHPGVEVVVIDDGSTDSSPKVIEQFGDSIRSKRVANQGVNHARNEALAMARGEWIQYLDADDYLLPDKVGTQLAEGLAQGAADVIYSPVLVEEWKGGSPIPLYPSRMSEKSDVYTRWIAWELPQTSGSIWRREWLRDIGGWDESPGQFCDEHELYFQALKKGGRFQYAPTPRTVYRIWSEETRCRRDPGLIIGSKTKLIDEMRQWMTAQGLWTEEHRRAAAQACFEMSRTLAKQDLAEAKRYHDARRKLGLIDLAGPAAPKSYQTAYRFLGFRGAEGLARLLR